MDFTCYVEFTLVDVKTGKGIKQVIEFPDTMAAQKWVEVKSEAWSDTHRILSPIISMGNAGRPSATHLPTKSLVERYSGAGSF